MKNQFTHLSVSSGYSFKYGTSHPQDLVAKAAELGMSRLALTDNENMAGAVVFAKACEQYGITPILGVNLGFIQKSDRITLLAQGGKLSSLYRLLTAVNTNNCDGVLSIEILERFYQYSSDLLLLHGPASSVLKNLVARKEMAALNTFKLSSKYFANTAIECVSHLMRPDHPYSSINAARAYSFAVNNQLPAVLTNQVRMKNASDGPIADLLDASRKLVLLSDASVERGNNQGYLKDSDQMYQGFIGFMLWKERPRSLFKIGHH